MIIKVLLVAAVLGVALYLVRSGPSGRRLAVTRISGLLFAACGVAAILFPDLVTSVANALGVGRGTDLVLYLLVIAFLFATVTQRQHLRELDDKVAQLTRELALHQASEAAPDEH